MGECGKLRDVLDQNANSAIVLKEEILDGCFPSCAAKSSHDNTDMMR